MIFQLNLTDYQKQKMLNILRTGKSQGIRFSKDQLLQDKGNVLFKLEFDQLKRVYSALKSKHNKGVDFPPVTPQFSADESTGEGP